MSTTAIPKTFKGPNARQRLVGVIRLSKDTEESTSPQVQRRAIEGWANLHGADIVGWAEDLDVSATKYAPHERPELRSWLDRPEEWDGLLFWRLDRFVRSVIDFADMIRWCQPLGKNLISATEPIDLSTPIGTALAQIIVVFAELESATTRLRVLQGVAEKKLMGRWTGGDPTYGYKTVPARNHVEGCTWHACDCPRTEGLQIDFDEEVHTYAAEIISRLLSGNSRNSVCLDYGRREILAPSDYKRQARGNELPDKRAVWCPETLRNIVTSPTIRGLMSHNGEIVYGEDGMPVRVGPALVDDSQAAELLVRMEQKPRTRTEGAAPLLDVAFCDCGGKLHIWQAKRKIKGGEKLYRNYRCQYANKGQCDAGAITAEDLESLVSSYVQLPTMLGDIEVYANRLVPGEDHTEEIEQRREALDKLTERLGMVPAGPAMDAVLKAMGEHSEAMAQLEKLPQRAAEWVSVPTGETYAERWARMDWDGRRRLLTEGVFTLVAYRKTAGRGGAARKGTHTQILMCPGPDLAARLNAPERALTLVA
ncbi:recombinase family protein [Streptomyces sp. NPDC056257]|uniref:recombinase family protein n=1 Tax=Streptomyces sp. NPDC056257 TaxID=3345765 RepID=UPI0035E0E939